MKNKLLKIILIFWIIIFVFFFLRMLFKKNYIKQYFGLVGKSLAEKQSFLFGENFVKFFNYCIKNLPPSSTYKLVGIKTDSIEYARAIYYLYPNLKSENPDFILVFETNEFVEIGYTKLSSLDENNFILKKD